MRKIQISGLVLIAVFAFSAALTSSALAGEWLVEGAAVTATLNAETEGLIELLAFTGATSSVTLNTIDCEGILDGTIGPAGAATITKGLTLAKVEVGELTTEFFNCTVTSTKGELGDCSTALAEVWPQKLPWTLKMELMSNGETLLIFPTTSAYEVRCETSLGKLENLCEGAAPTAALTNETGTTPGSVLGVFAPFTATTERANCTLTGEHSAEVGGTGETWAVEGELGRLLTAVS